MPKDKTLLHDAPTAKIQPHKADEVPKDKTLPRDKLTAKTPKPDEVSKDKTHLQDTHKIHSHRSDEKIEVHDTSHAYAYIVRLQAHILDLLYL